MADKEKDKDMRMVAAQFHIDDIPLADEVASMMRMSRACMIRTVIMTFVRNKLAEKNNATTISAALGDIGVDLAVPSDMLINNAIEEEDEDLNDEDNIVDSDVVYDPALCGEPDSCPVCGAKEDGIGQPEISVMKSGNDWGAWGCYKCTSNGRWYDHQPLVILHNTRAAAALPITKPNNTPS